MEKLLIVDDSDEIRNQLKWGLDKEYAVMLAGNARDALALAKKHHPKVVVLDLGLPPNDAGTEEGFRCLTDMLGAFQLVKVIVITGNDLRENALKAIQSGAYDFYQKPIALEEFKVILSRAFYLHTLEEENRRLHEALEKKTSDLCGMVGQCPAMLDVFSTVRKVASSDVSILIQGESGTGKELVAWAVHTLSGRRDGSFVAINCGAIPENLIESELFGHERGAFTGAHSQVQGKVEFAHRGTLFLDEIGELPAQLQVKLLRFLQDKTIQRVGGRENINVDARIISATNKDLGEEMAKGRFREDLYYRIGVVTIKLPPLRERKGDIILLATLFLRKFGEAFNRRIKGFSASSIEQLESYPWPGNVRELENRIQRAVILSGGPMIEPHDLGFMEKEPQPTAYGPEGMTLRDARNKVEKDMIILAIDRHRGNIARVAAELGVSRPTLYDIMKKHGLHSMPQQNSKLSDVC